MVVFHSNFNSNPETGPDRTNNRFPANVQRSKRNFLASSIQHPISSIQATRLFHGYLITLLHNEIRICNNFAFSFACIGGFFNLIPSVNQHIFNFSIFSIYIYFLFHYQSNRRRSSAKCLAEFERHHLTSLSWMPVT